MSRHRTKDELFVVTLLAEAQKAGDPHTPTSRYEVGEVCGLASKSVDTICKLLVQANFIKKAGEADVYLTDNGIQLAERLLEEHHPHN